jgi:hypothetical protein
MSSLDLLANMTPEMRQQLDNLLTAIGPKLRELGAEACRSFMGDPSNVSTLTALSTPSTVAMIMKGFQEQCGVVPVRPLAEWMSLAIMLNSYAQVRDDFSIPDLNLVTSGLTPTGTAATGAATTFVAAFNVAPGESILLKTRDYSLPFNPRCLWGMLGFNAGTDDANYRHVSMKVWVGPRNLTGTFALGASGPLYEWSPKRFIYGTQFRCGDSCTEVPLRSYTGCTSLDIVGLNSQIYIQVDNAATNANSISTQQQVIKLGGFETPCCNSCGSGGACGCKH